MNRSGPREPAPYLRPLSPVNDRRILLPLREGATVHVRLASRWERVAAFFLDTLVLGSAQLIAFTLSVQLNVEPQWIPVLIGGTSVYLLQTLYFSTFETLWNGQTPGKRLLELRTVRLDGEALSPWVLWLRSNVRMMEQVWPVLLAVLAYFTARGLFPFIAPFAALAVVLSTAFPLLNVYNQRLADFIAGTVVIEEPERATRFLPPLMESVVGPSFPTEFLRSFGTYELHVLESVLAQASRGDYTGVELVADTLCHRMAIPRRSSEDARAYVAAFHQQLTLDIAKNARDPKQPRW